MKEVIKEYNYLLTVRPSAISNKKLEYRFKAADIVEATEKAYTYLNGAVETLKEELNATVTSVEIRINKISD